ncbi:MAG: PaaX family transcriptional regulator [Actinomycetes bacterium]
MHARSALFDVYGDHLRHRGDSAPVAALVRLLAPLDIAAPAVRTAVSRMVRQGWLRPAPTSTGPGYALTPRAVRRVDDALARVYRTTRATSWDGTWHLLVLPRPTARPTRERVHAGLGFLGFAPLADSTWIGPRATDEVDVLLATEGVPAKRFTATHDGDCLGLVRNAWDLDGLGLAYRRWLSEATELVDGLDDETCRDGRYDEQAFAVRSRLLHEWRKFLFTDPGLPSALLPPGWPGTRAAAFFDEWATRLAPAAARFVDSVLAGSVPRRRTRTLVPPAPVPPAPVPPAPEGNGA